MMELNHQMVEIEVEVEVEVGGGRWFRRNKPQIDSRLA